MTTTKSIQPTDPAPDGTPDAVQSAESEHRVIKRLLVTLEESTVLPRVRDCLDSLERLLPAHFDGEEAPDGLYEELRLLQPALNTRLDRLQDDHLSLKEQLEGLCELVARAQSVLDELRVSKRAFIDHLRLHEATESGLLADAYYVDLGESD